MSLILIALDPWLDFGLLKVGLDILNLYSSIVSGFDNKQIHKQIIKMLYILIFYLAYHFLLYQHIKNASEKALKIIL